MHFMHEAWACWWCDKSAPIRLHWDARCFLKLPTFHYRFTASLRCSYQMREWTLLRARRMMLMTSHLLLLILIIYYAQVLLIPKYLWRHDVYADDMGGLVATARPQIKFYWRYAKNAYYYRRRTGLSTGRFWQNTHHWRRWPRSDRHDSADTIYGRFVMRYRNDIFTVCRH